MMAITPILVSVAPNSPSSSSSAASPRTLGGGSARDASTQAPMAATNGASCCSSARQARVRRLRGRGWRERAPASHPWEAPREVGRGERRRGGGKEAVVAASIGCRRGEKSKWPSRGLTAAGLVVRTTFPLSAHLLRK